MDSEKTANQGDSMHAAIPKGFLVTVITTNGGEIVGRLEHDYVPSFAVDLDTASRSIMAHRIVSVVVTCTVCGAAPCVTARS